MKSLKIHNGRNINWEHWENWDLGEYGDYLMYYDCWLAGSSKRQWDGGEDEGW